MGIRLEFTGLTDRARVMDRIVSQNKPALCLLRVLQDCVGRRAGRGGKGLLGRGRQGRAAGRDRPWDKGCRREDSRLVRDEKEAS